MKSRARCAGFSVMEIGNRKERVRDYASFPDESPSGGFGRQPNVTPVLSKIAKRIKKESRSEASLIPQKLL